MVFEIERRKLLRGVPDDHVAKLARARRGIVVIARRRQGGAQGVGAAHTPLVLDLLPPAPPLARSPGFLLRSTLLPPNLGFASTALPPGPVMGRRR
jgi:hypothetical protein